MRGPIHRGTEVPQPLQGEDLSNEVVSSDAHVCPFVASAVLLLRTRSVLRDSISRNRVVRWVHSPPLHPYSGKAHLRAFLVELLLRL